MIKMQIVLTEIGKETIGLAEHMSQIVDAVARPHPLRRQRDASKVAAALNRRCLRIEIAAERLIEVTNAALEASKGSLEHHRQLLRETERH